jgi:hypothetical protein
MALPWFDNPYGWSAVGANLQAVYDVAHDLGFTNFRSVFNWSNQETVQGTVNWANALDADVLNAWNNHINYTFVVDHVNTWEQQVYSGSPCTSAQIAPGSSVNTADGALWIISQVLNRYNGSSGRGKIARVEIANEGFDDSGVSSPCSSFRDTVPILNAVYPWVKANYPDVLVGTAAHFNHNTYSSVYNVQASLYNDIWGSAKGKFDYSNFHFYGCKIVDNCANGNAGFASLVQGINDANKFYGNPTPIYMTEGGVAVPQNGTETDRYNFYVGQYGPRQYTQQDALWVAGNPNTIAGIYADAIASGAVTHIYMWTLSGSDSQSLYSGSNPPVPNDPTYHAVKQLIQLNPQWVYNPFGYPCPH